MRIIEKNHREEAAKKTIRPKDTLPSLVISCSVLRRIMTVKSWPMTGNTHVRPTERKGSLDYSSSVSSFFLIIVSSLLFSLNWCFHFMSLPLCICHILLLSSLCSDATFGKSQHLCPILFSSKSLQPGVQMEDGIMCPKRDACRRNLVFRKEYLCLSDKQKKSSWCNKIIKQEFKREKSSKGQK